MALSRMEAATTLSFLKSSGLTPDAVVQAVLAASPSKIKTPTQEEINILKGIIIKFYEGDLSSIDELIALTEQETAREAAETAAASRAAVVVPTAVAVAVDSTAAAQQQQIQQDQAAAHAASVKAMEEAVANAQAAATLATEAAAAATAAAAAHAAMFPPN